MYFPSIFLPFKLATCLWQGKVDGEKRQRARRKGGGETWNMRYGRVREGGKMRIVLLMRISRRLKCNREHPCQNCVARGEANAATCEYAEKTDRRLRHLGGQRGDGEEMRYV